MNMAFISVCFRIEQCACTITIDVFFIDYHDCSPPNPNIHLRATARGAGVRRVLIQIAPIRQGGAAAVVPAPGAKRGIRDRLGACTCTAWHQVRSKTVDWGSDWRSKLKFQSVHRCPHSVCALNRAYACSQPRRPYAETQGMEYFCIRIPYRDRIHVSIDTHSIHLPSRDRIGALQSVDRDRTPLAAVVLTRVQERCAQIDNKKLKKKWV